jgi:serine/threonine protein kinase
MPEYVLITKEQTYEKILAGDVCEQLPTRPGGVVVLHDNQLKYVNAGDCVQLEKGLGPLGPRSFQTVRSLGAGAHASVTSVRHARAPRTCFAMKTIAEGTGKEKSFEEVQRLARTLWSSHVVSFVNYFFDGRELNIITLPVADSNLEGYLQNVRGCLSPGVPDFQTARLKIFQWIACLAKTLSMLHRADLIHRDIKPENVLVHGTNILYTDFGIAYSRTDATAYHKTSTEGSYQWIPPEAIDENNGQPYWFRAGRKGDVFSLGCVLYEMLLAATPDTLLIGKPLPSRKEEIWAYHMTVSEGGLYRFVENIQEDAQRMGKLWGTEHAGLIGLTKYLLILVTRNMVVQKDVRISAEESSAAIDQAMHRQNWKKLWSCSCDNC